MPATRPVRSASREDVASPRIVAATAAAKSTVAAT